MLYSTIYFEHLSNSKNINSKTHKTLTIYLLPSSFLYSLHRIYYSKNDLLKNFKFGLNISTKKGQYLYQKESVGGNNDLYYIARTKVQSVGSYSYYRRPCVC